MKPIIDFMQRINPKNSLFGKILVWFWLALTLMIVMAFFVARYANQSWEISAIEDKQLQKAEIIQQDIQRLLSKDVSLNRALRRVSGRGRWNLVVINNATDELTLGFPPTLLNQKKRFLTLKDAQHPLLLRTNNMEFVGPLLLRSNTDEYQLFVGRLLRREEKAYFAFGLAFFVFLFTGTVACIAIAWTITKPIKQLSKLSKDFAAGVVSDSSSKPSLLLKSRKDELGQLHNDIYDMATNLAKSVSQQKALMANISHELRTPLTRLQLALAMLSPNSKEQLLYAKQIEKDIKVMDDLIGQALQLAKMGDENQAQWMQINTVDLHDVLNPVLKNLEFEANASKVTLQINKFDNTSLPLVEASFVSAIENVTRNAIKYSQHKVNVTIELVNLARQSSDDKQQATLGENITSTATPKSMLSICIEDDGEGLSLEQMSHIFEPFYRAPSGKHHQGTGLGLAIAKASVQLHRGEIKVNSSQLGGLCFTLLFPLELIQAKN